MEAETKTETKTKSGSSSTFIGAYAAWDSDLYWALWRTVPWTNWSSLYVSVFLLPLLLPLLLYLASPAWLLAAAPLLARCKLQLQLLFAVSFFIFESSSCTRSMESSASHSSPTPTPASASSPASAPSAVPAAVRRRDAFSRCLRISKFCFQRNISENRSDESRTSTCRYPVSVRKIRFSPYIL